MERTVALVISLILGLSGIHCGGGEGGGEGGGGDSMQGNVLMGGVFGWDPQTEEGRKLLIGAIVSLPEIGVSVKTNEAGDYTISKLPNGSFTPKAELEGYNVVEKESPIVFTGETKIYWSPLLYPKVNTLSGNVRIMVGYGIIEPLRGAEIEIVGTDLKAQSNAKGNFGIDKIPSGDFDIKITCQYGIQFYKGSFTGETHQVIYPLFFMPGLEYNFVAGTVINEMGEKIRDAKIFKDEFASTGSDIDGYYELWIPENGSLKITAEKEGFVSASVYLEFTGKNRHNWNPELLYERCVKGITQSDKFGQVRPLADVRVSIAGTNIFVLSGADGKFLLPNPPIGQYVIYAEKEGFRTEISALDINDNSRLEWNIILTEE